MEKEEKIEKNEEEKKQYKQDFLAELDAKSGEDFLKNQKIEQEIEEQAKYVAYLSNIKVSEIKDTLCKELVREILASSQTRKAKAETIEKIMMQSEMKHVLERAEKAGNFSHNFAFKKLKELEKKGRDLGVSELSDSKLLLDILNADLKKIGVMNISRGIQDEVSFDDMNFFDKLDLRIKQIINQKCAAR